MRTQVCCQCVSNHQSGSNVLPLAVTQLLCMASCQCLPPASFSCFRLFNLVIYLRNKSTSFMDLISVQTNTTVTGKQVKVLYKKCIWLHQKSSCQTLGQLSLCKLSPVRQQRYLVTLHGVIYKSTPGLFFLFSSFQLEEFQRKFHGLHNRAY